MAGAGDRAVLAREDTLRLSGGLLRNAARALYLYYGKDECDYQPAEPPGTFERVGGFAPAPRPTIGDVDMPLLVPEYEETPGGAGCRAPFAMSRETRDRFRAWLDRTSDAVLAVRDGLSGPEIQGLREMTAGRNVRIVDGKDYASLPFLQRRLRAHLATTGRAARGIRELDERTDIVHFRQIRAQLDPDDPGRIFEDERTSSAMGKAG